MLNLFEPQKLGRGPIISLTVLVLAGLMCYVSLSRSAAALEISFERAAPEQLWRFLTSAVAVEGWFELLINFFYLVVLMQISEAVKGSLFYAVDAAVKVFLINCFTLGLFSAVRLLPHRPEGFLHFVLRLQVLYPNRGFAGLFVLELFLKLTHFRTTSAFRLESRVSALLLNLCFACVCLAHCFRLELPAALAVGVCFCLPLLNYLDVLYKLNCMHQLDHSLLWARRMLFLRSAQREGKTAAVSMGYHARRLDDSAEHRLQPGVDTTFEAPTKPSAQRPPRRELPALPAPPVRDRFAIDNYEI